MTKKGREVTNIEEWKKRNNRSQMFEKSGRKMYYQENQTRIIPTLRSNVEE